jgi:hypothetical protein
MFFYIFHHLNHYLFRPTDKTDAAVNVRTLIFGGIAYILLHGYLNKSTLSSYPFKDYFWWIFAIDVIAMSVIYRNYYGESIINEISNTFGKKEEPQVKNDKDMNTKVSYFNNDKESRSTNSSVSEKLSEAGTYVSKVSSRSPTISSSKKGSIDKSSIDDDELIDKMLHDTKSM